ncbi:hypothetical protein ACROYT_G025662 [Oculina patagonica]
MCKLVATAFEIYGDMASSEIYDAFASFFSRKLKGKSFEIVRAVGNKIISWNISQGVTGRVLKHLTGQGPVYLRCKSPIETEYAWATDEESDEGDGGEGDSSKKRGKHAPKKWQQHPVFKCPTPWVSHIVVAPKPKSPGKVCVCVDMRQANKAIKRERHVTLTIKEMIGDLNGAKVFSRLDLNQSYNQLALAPESWYITTFGTHMGLMRYKRLNFGISSAAEIFQNVIGETLEGIDGAKNISDDILVFSKSHKEHDQNLRGVFQHLREKGLILNKGKYGISPYPKKVEEVVNLSTPSTASEVHSLLGMTNYCSRFIPDYATETEPLRKLTHKDQPWHWTTEHDHAVSQLREALSSAPVTAYFDPEKETKISVDAEPITFSHRLTRRPKKDM